MGLWAGSLRAESTFTRCTLLLRNLVGRRKLTFSKLLTDHPLCLTAELSVSSQDLFVNWRLLTKKEELERGQGHHGE